MMVEPVTLTTIVGIVAALVGGGGVAALIKSRAEARTGDAGILISRERAKVEITMIDTVAMRAATRNIRRPARAPVM